MTPTVVGIGVPRGGSTWLHQLLNAHPDIAMPQRRKEIHYFTREYNRGLAWYENFFPPDSESARYKAVGEVTPHYLFHPEAPHRIADLPTIRGVIAILRNPIDRAFSHFLWRMRYDRFTGSFEQFLDAHPDATRWSRYNEPLQRYFEVFGRERVLVLISEWAFADPLATRRRIADFVGVDDGRFPESAGHERVNQAELPQRGRLFWIAGKAGAWFRRHNMDWLPNAVGVGRLRRFLIGRSGTLPKLTEEQRHEVFARFSDDVEALEQLLNVNLNHWRPQVLTSSSPQHTEA